MIDFRLCSCILVVLIICMLLTLAFIYSIGGYKVKGGTCADFTRGIYGDIKACVSFGIVRDGANVYIKPGLDTNDRLFTNGWNIGVYMEIDSTTLHNYGYIPEGYHTPWNNMVRDPNKVAKIVGICIDEFWGALELMAHLETTTGINNIEGIKHAWRINSNFDGDRYEFYHRYPQDCSHGSREGIILEFNNPNDAVTAYDNLWNNMCAFFHDFNNCNNCVDRYEFLYDKLMNTPSLNLDVLYKFLTHESPPPRTRKEAEKMMKRNIPFKVFKTQTAYREFIIERLLDGKRTDPPCPIMASEWEPVSTDSEDAFFPEEPIFPEEGAADRWNAF